MRAAVVTGPGEVRIDRVPLPEPGPGQVRIHLQGCGVCASNLTPWEGPEWMRFPTAPGDLGHEGWGLVDAVGAGVTGLKPGDRVGALSGKSYAEFDIADALAVVKLPDSLHRLDLPLEPLGCAMNIFRRSDIHEGQTVAVIGATENPGTVGRTVLWNLVTSPFGGTVYPVNPKRPSVLGWSSCP